LDDTQHIALKAVLEASSAFSPNKMGTIRIHMTKATLSPLPVPTVRGRTVAVIAVRQVHNR
jgi:hypothetical protein